MNIEVESDREPKPGEVYAVDEDGKLVYQGCVDSRSELTHTFTDIDSGFTTSVATEATKGTEHGI